MRINELLANKESTKRGYGIVMTGPSGTHQIDGYSFTSEKKLRAYLNTKHYKSVFRVHITNEIPDYALAESNDSS